jgi:ligand-binding SRPBCC domain-containing protein
VKVALSTNIDLPPDEVWRRVQTPDLLMHIAAPLVRFHMVNPANASNFGEQERFLVDLTLFGVLPFGKQWIVPTVHLDDAATWPKKLRDNGYSALIKTWDHWITVEPDGVGGTHYRDEVEVKAGLLTSFVWLFAQIFYRHRQRRWRALARSISESANI